MDCAAAMASVNQALRFPDGFRKTITVMHLDPVSYLQRTINMASLFAYMRKQEEEGRQIIMNRLIVELMWFQSMNDGWDGNLYRTNIAYLQRLLDLSNATALTDRTRDRRALRCFTDWSRKVAPFLTYPREVLLENGKVLQVPFNFFLLSLVKDVSVKYHLQIIMGQFALDYQTAHLFSGTEVWKNPLGKLKYDLLRFKNVFLPITLEQKKLLQKHERDFNELIDIIREIKSAEKRFPLVRKFMNEWYSETVKLNQHINAYQIGEANGM